MKCFFAVALSSLFAVGCSGDPGVVRHYYTNGEPKEMIVRDGTSIQWNTDKSIRNRCEYKNGEPYEGRWITDWRRNLLHEEREYKNGRLHGDWIKYDWKGRPKWGRSYYMGVVSKKMWYREGEPWRVEEYPERVDRVNARAEKLARKIEERERKRLEKEARKKEARERKEEARKERLQERRKAREEREKKREEAVEKAREEREEAQEERREEKEQQKEEQESQKEEQKEQQKDQNKEEKVTNEGG